MDEIFKKLRDFETPALEEHSDWDSLEKKLDKEDRKPFLWIDLSSIILILFFTTGNQFLKVNSSPNIQQYSALTSNNPEQIIPVSNQELELEKPAILSTTRISSSPKKPSKSSTIQSNSYLVRKFGIQTTPVLDSIILQQNKKDKKGKKKSNLQTNYTSSHYCTTIPLLFKNQQQQHPLNLKLSKSSTIKVRGSITDTARPEYFIPTFGITVGIKFSSLNRVSKNSETTISHGIGAMVKLNYDFSRYFTVCLDIGINSEYNQNLNYSYLAERKTFLELSDKIINLSTKQTYSSNLLLSASYKWNTKLITSAGAYYNTVLQTVSEVHESGTGEYSNLGNQTTRKRGYSDLLNKNEVGLSFSQTFKPNKYWGVTLGLHKGLTNRISQDYFPGLTNKRTEVSLTISKKIL